MLCMMLKYSTYPECPSEGVLLSGDKTETVETFFPYLFIIPLATKCESMMIL